MLEMKLLLKSSDQLFKICNRTQFRSVKIVLPLIYFFKIIFQLSIKNKEHYKNTNNTHMYDSDVFFEA